MSRFSEKQMLLMTIGGFAVVIGGFAALTYMDWQKIYAAELGDHNPGAQEIMDPELWGERRKIQDLQGLIDGARAQADLIPKREQDVIVYREILERDSKILPNETYIHELTNSIGEFERISGAALSRISDLNTNHGGQAIANIPIKIEATGSYDEILKFINLFESVDRLVNTRGFSISAGPVTGAGRDAKARHRVSMEFVTYMYTQNAGLAKPVAISEYDKRAGTDVIQRLIRQKKAAQIDTYDLKARINRRDPLIDPRRSKQEVVDDTSTDKFDDQKALVNRLRLEVELLKEDVRQEAVYLEERRYVQYSQIKQMIDAKIARLDVEIREAEPAITIPELKAIFTDDVVEPFFVIKAGRETDDDAPKFITRKTVEQFREKMNEGLDDRNYEAVTSTYRDFESLVAGMELADDAAPLVEEMRDLRQNAQVMLDFEQLRLTYTGAIILPKGSRLIVNGRTRKEGDYVDPENRCRVIEIRKDRVIYEFDGFEIVDFLKAK